MRIPRVWRFLWLVVPVTGAVFWIYVASAGARVDQASARLMDLNGNVVGRVTFTQLPGFDSRVRFSVHDLPDGFHGFHVHVTGACEAAGGFSSAGGHFNPTNDIHPTHDGDMPPILVGADGEGDGSFVTDRFEVGDIVGAAVIVHANPDNFANVPVGEGEGDYTPNSPAAIAMTQNTGNAGPRIACGVIGERD